MINALGRYGRGEECRYANDMGLRSRVNRKGRHKKIIPVTLQSDAALVTQCSDCAEKFPPTQLRKPGNQFRNG